MAAEAIALIKELATTNRLWGAERLRGELLKLGIRVAKTTVQRHPRRPTAAPRRPDLGDVPAQPYPRDLGLRLPPGPVAGAGTVLLPPALGLSGATTGRTGATAVLTVALYTAGGIAVGAVYQALPN